ncbi:TlpA family protein disulfide reductase [Dyadobacter aurulentus]|uniref:TlpA family protein disulfide reductase n=1 Tax=Dyadobacter sp. UC 10 TaxID=2605428 RepID=UPI0011F105D9|nr:TlpA disulfide reductase family protein [Dyadobacter sp. UC 10]KAA0992032.1 TlpA family protein disulfide reductase [Dyadobacter sp. UC 10]
MKNLLLIFLVFAFSCSQNDNKEENKKTAEQPAAVAKKDSVITLEIHAKPGDQFFFNYVDRLFNFNILETPEKLKKDSLFIETIISHTPVLLKDIHWKAQNYIYLIPGEKYRITKDSMISHFELTGDSKRTYELNAWKELKKHAAKQKRISEFDFTDQARYQKFSRMDFNARDSVLRSEYEDNIRFLDNYASKNNFSNDQKKILSRTLYYQFKVAHFFFNKRKPDQTKKYLDSNRALYNELQPAMNCDSCFDDPEFPYLTQVFAKHYVADPDKVGTENAYSAYSKAFSGKTRDYLLYNLIKLGGMFNDTKPNPKLARQFQNDAQDPALKGYIKEMYDFLESKKSSAGYLANAAGENISWKKLLENHRNKVVYVDFWASWCGPCRAEAPASKTLRKKFEGKDVVFLTVSMDENSAAWKKASKKDGIDNPENYILIQPAKSDLKKQYQITSIPRYFLIDKSGKVVNSNASRPSDEAIITEITRLL